MLIQAIITMFLLFPLIIKGEEIEVTVYGNRQGIIRETKEIFFKKGINEISINEISKGINPTTVSLKGKKWDINILEQNYRYDLINANAIYEKYLGKEIELSLKNGKIIKGILLAVPKEKENNIYGNREFQDKVILESHKDVHIFNISEIISSDFPELPEGLATVPKLVWKLNSEKEGKQKTELSYITTGLNWSADYIATVNSDDSELEISSLITVSNQTNKKFENAKLKVIAGNLHKVRTNSNRNSFSGNKTSQSITTTTISTRKVPRKEDIFEYKLYKIPFKINLVANETKQLTLLEKKRAKAKKLFKLSLNNSQNKFKAASVFLQIKNTKENGLGIPLPEGMIRFYKSDSDGSEQLIGEHNINHTPINEKITFRLGTSFDIVGNKTLIEEKKENGRIEKVFNLSVRNHKSTPIAIEISTYFRQLNQNWETKILTDDTKFKRENNYLYFPVKLEANSEKELNYTVISEKVK